MCYDCRRNGKRIKFIPCIINLSLRQVERDFFQRFSLPLTVSDHSPSSSSAHCVSATSSFLSLQNNSRVLSFSLRATVSLSLYILSSFTSRICLPLLICYHLLSSLLLLFDINISVHPSLSLAHLIRNKISKIPSHKEK